MRSIRLAWRGRAIMPVCVWLRAWGDSVVLLLLLMRVRIVMHCRRKAGSLQTIHRRWSVLPMSNWLWRGRSRWVVSQRGIVLLWL